MSLVSLKNITKSYSFGKNNYQILKDINLEIQQGELLSIVGPSGSGKSTLLKFFPGETNPSQQEVFRNRGCGYPPQHDSGGAG